LLHTTPPRRRSHPKRALLDARGVKRRGIPTRALGEDGASGTLSLTPILWPVAAAILAALVLVAGFLLVFFLRRKVARVRASIRGRAPPTN
jgi:hypothetical protein